MASSEWRVSRGHRERQREECCDVAQVQHGARGYEVASDPDEEIGHVSSRGEDARGAVHEPWRADDGPDDPLDDPLAAELPAARAVVRGQRGVGTSRVAGT